MIGSSQPSAESGAVYALLATVADPKKTKARLDEIEKARAELEAAQEKHRVTLDALRQTTEVNVNALAASDKLLAERHAQIANEQNALSIATAGMRRDRQELEERNAVFTKAHADASAQLEQLAENNAKRELELNAREQSLTDCEERVARDARAAAALMDEARAIKADYNRRSAALQEALKK